MSIPIGARVWALQAVPGRPSTVVLGLGELFDIAEGFHYVKFGDWVGTYAASDLVLDTDADTLALSPGHHEAGLRRLVGEAVTAIRMEARLDALDATTLRHFREWRTGALCEQEPHIRDRGIPMMVAAGLVQAWPGNDVPPELTDLGHALARRLSHP